LTSLGHNYTQSLSLSLILSLSFLLSLSLSSSLIFQAFLIG